MKLRARFAVSRIAGDPRASLPGPGKAPVCADAPSGRHARANKDQEGASGCRAEAPSAGALGCRVDALSASGGNQEGTPGGRAEAPSSSGGKGKGKEVRARANLELAEGEASNSYRLFVPHSGVGAGRSQSTEFATARRRTSRLAEALALGSQRSAVGERRGCVGVGERRGSSGGEARGSSGTVGETSGFSGAASGLVAAGAQGSVASAVVGERFVVDEAANARGFRRSRLRWPLALGACRPTLLGGALQGMSVPGKAAFATLIQTLQASPRGGGGTPMIALDTETTGLGQNAGTIAFLVGIAWFEGEALVVEQWTLTRLSAEAAMLRSLCQELDALAGPSTVLLTFNGASFDLPLLRARCRRYELRATALSANHVDLLPPARRLWREQMPDCRLSTLERSCLGVVRHDDVGGQTIPQAYWSWLESPEEPEASVLLQRVHVHNQVDLLTLPALAAEIASVIESPKDVAQALRVARLQIARGDQDAALRVLQKWLPAVGEASQIGAPEVATVEVEPAGRHALGGIGERMLRLGMVAGRVAPVSRLRALDDAERTRAGRGSAKSRAAKSCAEATGGGQQAWALAAKLLRRRGDVAQSAAIWARLCELRPGDPEAHEALAKLLEHHLHDLPQALRVASASSVPCTRRLARLRRKLAKHSRREPDSVYG